MSARTCARCYGDLRFGLILQGVTFVYVRYKQVLDAICSLVKLTQCTSLTHGGGQAARPGAEHRP